MKTGLFGGTFNPVHLGHINAAETVFKRLMLDEIVFMPVYTPPHKESGDLASGRDRINMLESALAGREHFNVSDLEIRRKGRSYTIDTLKDLRLKTDNEIYFIMGSDSFLSFQTWHKWKDILKIANLAVVYRPDFFYKDTNLFKEGFYWEGENRICHVEYKDIYFIDIKGFDVSSTGVRDLIKNKKVFHPFVDDKVADYIEEKGLYK